MAGNRVAEGTQEVVMSHVFEGPALVSLNLVND